MKHFVLVVFFIIGADSVNCQDYAYVVAGDKPVNFYSHSGNAGSSEITVIPFEPVPVYTLIRSSSGSGGSSKNISTSNGTYNVSQSIGQGSVIGTTTKNGYSILQGYQQRVVSRIPSLSLTDQSLPAMVYPNPFSESINILFRELITDDVLIMVFDATGRMVISKKMTASILVTVPLSQLPKGAYILKAMCGNKKFSAGILKK